MKQDKQEQQHPTPAGERGRWSARRKLVVVLRVQRDEDLDAPARALTPHAGIRYTLPNPGG